jgi:hypothetical protein
MIRIVAMEREYGAGGSAIEQKLAERLIGSCGARR